MSNLETLDWVGSTISRNSSQKSIEIESAGVIKQLEKYNSCNYAQNHFILHSEIHQTNSLILNNQTREHCVGFHRIIIYLNILKLTHYETFRL